MGIHFKELCDELDELIEFMVNDIWEFYGTPNVEPESVRRAYENNYYNGEGTKTFWILSENETRIGIIRLYDLNDGTPLFDIRIPRSYKGMGIGTVSVKWLVDYLFNTYPEINRIEGNTRQDNYAMRCVFSKCGFAKEAHYRKGWQCRNGEVYDAIGYGITREDWHNKSITPVAWNDFKC